MAALAPETAVLTPASPGPRRRRLFGYGIFLPLGLLMVIVFVVLALAPQLVAHFKPDAIYVGPRFAEPNRTYLFGTDEVGRDLFSRVVYGARISLGMSFVVVLVGAVIGSIGFVEGIVDDILMRIVDLFLSLPGFILALAIAAVLGRGIRSVVVALAIVWWPGYARLVRGMVLNVKHRLHVEAARAAGASSPYIVWRHIFPFMVTQMNARTTQDIGYALVNVAGLSFLGLGAQVPTPEWGALLNSGRTYVLNAWWYAVFPGLAITLWTVGVSMLGDAISEWSGGSRVVASS